MKYFPIRRYTGLTLIELLISIGMSGILIAGLYRTFINQQKTYTIQNQVADMQQDVRIAMGQMIREIRMAGFGNVDYVLSLSGGVNGFTQVTTTNSDHITVVGAFRKISVLPNGANAGRTVVTLASVTEASEFDVGGKSFISIGGIESNKVIGVLGANLTLNKALTNSHPPGAPVFQIRAIGYRLGKSFGKQVLERNGNNGAAGHRFVAVAENIENLQFQYFDRDGNMTAMPSNVSLVRVTATARTDRIDPEFKGGEGYRKRVLTSSIQLRNLGRLRFSQ